MAVYLTHLKVAFIIVLKSATRPIVAETTSTGVRTSFRIRNRTVNPEKLVFHESENVVKVVFFVLYFFVSIPLEYLSMSCLGLPIH